MSAYCFICLSRFLSVSNFSPIFCLLFAASATFTPYKQVDDGLTWADSNCRCYFHPPCFTVAETTLFVQNFYCLKPSARPRRHRDTLSRSVHDWSLIETEILDNTVSFHISGTVPSVGTKSGSYFHISPLLTNMISTNVITIHTRER